MAAAVLSSVFLTLLLSLHFHLWSGGWMEGDLEEAVQEQEALLGTGIFSEREISAQGFAQDAGELRLKGGISLSDGILLFAFFLSGIFAFPAVFFVLFFSEFLPGATLCSLSVRMNR